LHPQPGHLHHAVSTPLNPNKNNSALTSLHSQSPEVQ
jgi:hypothetical protein